MAIVSPMFGIYMKKWIINKLIVFILLINYIFSTSCLGQELSARLYLLAGSEIYANSNMQAKVRVFYQEINDSDTLNFEFKQFHTEASLPSLGWRVTDVDNGFDHNLSSAFRSIRSIKPDDFGAHKDFYISSSIPSSELTACLEISVQKEGEKHLLFTSCNDHGIDNGTVNIFARRPPRFIGDDFVETTHVETFRTLNKDKTKFENIGILYGLVPGGRVPRSFKFKMLNSSAYTIYKDTVMIADNDTAYVHNRVEFDAFNVKKPSYSARYLFDASTLENNDQEMIFKIYDISNTETKSYHIYRTGEEHIVSILELLLFNNSFMFDKRHCHLPGIHYDEFYCYNYLGTETRIPNNLETWKKMHNRFYTDVQLQDNYGGIHNIRLSPYGW